MPTPNWIRIFTNRDAGLATYFRREAEIIRERNPGINHFALTANLRNIFEGGDRWHEYLAWARDRVADAPATDPPTRIRAADRLPQPDRVNDSIARRVSLSNSDSDRPLESHDIRNYVFHPDEDERGVNYLSTFLEINNRWNKVISAIPYTIQVQGEPGVDYSGIYRDVTTDFLQYWTSSLNFGFRRGLCQHLNFPRFTGSGSIDLKKMREFGQLIGYLAGLKRSNPMINGYSLNLGLNLDFGSFFWALYDEKLFNQDNILGYYLHSLSPENASRLTKRLMAGLRLEPSTADQYPITDTVVRLVTQHCSSFDELDKYLPSGQLIREFTLNYTCKWAHDTESSEFDSAALSSVTEFEWLSGWLELFFRWYGENDAIRQFQLGMKEIAKYHMISSKELRNLLEGDGLDDSNIRENIMEHLQPESESLRSAIKRLLPLLSYNEIRQLLKFWTGTVNITSRLLVDVQRDSGLPTASTCFFRLHLPRDAIDNPSLLLARVRMALEHDIGTGLA